MKGHDFQSTNPDRHGSLLAKAFFCLVTMSVLSSAGCATVGYEFPVDLVPEIRIGETTQSEIRLMFGPPWRIGFEDGRRTWTYGRYRYRLLGETSTEDLVVRFDQAGVVISYTFNTTEHQE